MKKILYSLFALTVLMSCKTKGVTKETSTEVSVEVNSESEKWITLFDGSNFDSWKGYLDDGMYDEWSIDGDAMLFTPGGKGKNIITKQKFTSFELAIDWKISEGGNSGVFWGVFEDAQFKEAYHTGPEIQVLDNERHPDAKANPKYHQAGALYDLVQPTSDVCNPAGEWNKVLLKIDHTKNEGSVTLNGTVIVEFPVHGAGWDELVANSKFKGWKAFGKYKTGHIGLQDHGNKVWYRNIKIKELN